MVTISELGRKAWRKWKLDGVSSSGANEPTTDDIFPFVDAVDKAVTDLSAGYDVSYELRSQLFADLNWAAGKTARVFGDPNTAYIGVYKKNGGVGTGSWTRIGPLPGADTTALESRVETLETVVPTKRTDSMGTQKVLGRATVGTGPIEELGVGGGLVVDAGAAQLRLSPAAEATFKGRRVGTGIGTPVDMTVAQALEVLRLNKVDFYDDSAEQVDDVIDKFGNVIDKGIEVEADGRERHRIGYDLIPSNQDYPDIVADQFGFIIDPENLDAGGNTIVAGNLWAPSVYDKIEALAKAEVDRLNAFDVSNLAKVTSGAVLRAKTGQSFRAASDNAKLFASATEVTNNLGWKFNSFSVGPDSRCVNSGPTFVTFNSDDRALYALREHFIGATNTDLIYTDAQALAGSYPDNARGGHPDPAEEFVWQWMRRDWQLKPHNTAETTFYTVAMNHAKTDGLASEVFLGDGLSRFQSMCDVFHAAVSGLNGAAPSTVGVGNTDPMIADWIAMDHGQADEAAATSDYTLRVNNFGVAVQAKFNAKWGQTATAFFTMTQVGGPRYGTTDMVCAQQQGDMMLDITTASKNKFLAGVSWEGPSFYDIPDGSAHPNAPNSAALPTPIPPDGHLTLAGNILLAIRHAVVAHYVDRGEHYFLPFPMDGYFDGKFWVIPIPNKFPPLELSKMPIGVTMALLASLGISFRTPGRALNPITTARIVPGKNYTLEGACEYDFGTFGSTVCRFGDRDTANGLYGFVNLRDSFEAPNLKIELPMTANQTVYAGGYVDNPHSSANNGHGRYLEDIPEFKGRPKLGNPCIRRTITMHPITDIL